MRESQMVASGVRQENDICRIFFQIPDVNKVKKANASTIDLHTWHEQLGYVNKQILCDLMKRGLFVTCM